MTENTPTVDETRSRRRKAILAGGVVLGLGAAMTLAAWSDDVWVSGNFSAGSFNVEGAVDPAGTAWNEYDTQGTAGALTFTMNPQTMAPGDSVYAPLMLRVDPAADDYDANISIPTAPTGPVTVTTANNAFFNNLTVTLYNLPATSCTATATATATAIPDFNNVALTTTTANTILTLDNDDTVGQGVCFQVTLSDAAPATVQGATTGDLTWQFHAESVDPTP